MNKQTAVLIALYAGWMLTADTAHTTTYEDSLAARLVSQAGNLPSKPESTGPFPGPQTALTDCCKNASWEMAAIRHLKLAGPANVKRTVALPVRKPNAAYRSREHLTEREVERLVEAAKDNRWSHWP